MTEERVKRKLTAILSSDAAGYSRLMGEDEVSTVKTLEAYRKVMADLIEQFRGRVVDSPGDNLLAEFSSVVDAVQCAVEIHEVIKAKNEELPENRRMLFRIGINLGDVIEEGNRIYGDGVNIAARLEGLAEPGGICISGSAHEQIKNKLALGYEYIGEHAVKNIAEPLKVYRVPVGPKAVTPKEGSEKEANLKKWKWTAFGAAGAIIVIIGALAIWNFYPHGPSIEQSSIEPEQAPVVMETAKTQKTIAVLPFADLSPEKDQEYFVDGLSEEILNSLCQIPDLGVTGRTSSFSFKGSNKTVQEIASALHVDNILEGSVRKAGNELRITAQLVRASDELHIWSKTYDRELKDIFAVQEDIATAVANELKVTLGIGKSLKKLGGTDNVEAYELYLLALGQINNDERTQALESLNSALKLDPDFTLAWVLKTIVHSSIAAREASATRIPLEIEAAVTSSQKAVELEPNLAEAIIAQGHTKTIKHEWIQAELNYRKAIELMSGETSKNLDSQTKAALYMHYYAVGNLERARDLLMEVRRSDPLDATVRGLYITILGITYGIKQAEDENKLCEALFGDRWDSNRWAIISLRLGTGSPISYNEIVFSSPIYDVAKEHLDRPNEAVVELRRLYSDGINLRGGDFTDISQWAAYFKDTDLAMDAIEKAVSLQAAILFHAWSPVMHEVRQTPRFKKFVKEIGLVDYWNKFGWPDICHKLDNGDFECD